MRVDINGNNPIEPENVKRVMELLNEDYKDIGLKIKNLTCYIRFVDESGKVVEPTRNGNELRRTFTFTETVDLEDGAK